MNIVESDVPNLKDKTASYLTTAADMFSGSEIAGRGNVDGTKRNWEIEY